MTKFNTIGGHALRLLFLVVCTFSTSVFAQTPKPAESKKTPASPATKPAEAPKAPESTKPGTTVVVDVTGKVQVFEKGATEGKDIKKGEKIPVGATLDVGAGGRIDFALSNGVVIQLQENSRFTIEDFSQIFETVSEPAPLADAKKTDKKDDRAFLADLEKTDGTSSALKTVLKSSDAKLNLEYGTMVGKSEKQNPQSKLEITTPVGVAGIRGTIFRITITPVGGPGARRGGAKPTQFKVSIDVPEGAVSFGDAQGSKSVQIQPGFSLAMEASVPKQGEVKVVSVNTTQMSAERVTLLVTITNVVSEKKAAVIAADSSLGAQMAPEKSPGQAGDEGQASEAAPAKAANTIQLPPPIPAAPQPPPRPTPTPQVTPTPVQSNLGSGTSA